MGVTYTFQDVAATLTSPTGTVDLGFGAGVADEGISIEMAGDKNTMMIGADGEGMHSLHADKSGTVTVKLLKVSPTNAKLQAMYDAQSARGELWGQNFIAIRNVKSGDLTSCRSGAFKKKPALMYAKDGNVVEWTWDFLKIDSVLGVY